MGSITYTIKHLILMTDNNVHNMLLILHASMIDMDIK